MAVSSRIEKNVEFLSRELDIFSKLDWESILINQKVLKTTEVGGRQKFSVKGDYVQIEKGRDGRQTIKVDGVDPEGGGRVYGGPSASGAEVERANRFESASRYSGVLANNTIGSQENPHRDIQQFIKLLNKLNPRNEYYGLNVLRSEAFKFFEGEMNTLYNQYADQADLVMKGYNVKESKAADKIQDAILQETYTRHEKKAINNQLRKIVIATGFKIIPQDRNLKPERLSSIKKQTNLIDLVKHLGLLTYNKQQNFETGERGRIEINCPLSQGTEYKMLITASGWSSENPAIQAKFSGKNGEEAEIKNNDAISFLMLKEKYNFKQAVEYLASRISQPLNAEDFEQGPPAYGNGKNVVLVNYVESTGWLKYTWFPSKQEKANGVKPDSGTTLDFLQNVLGKDEPQARAYVMDFINKTWAVEEKEAFVERAKELPGYGEAFKDKGSMLNIVKATLPSDSAVFKVELTSLMQKFGVTPANSSASPVQEAEQAVKGNLALAK